MHAAMACQNFSLAPFLSRLGARDAPQAAAHPVRWPRPAGASAAAPRATAPSHKQLKHPQPQRDQLQQQKPAAPDALRPQEQQSTATAAGGSGGGGNDCSGTSVGHNRHAQSAGSGPGDSIDSADVAGGARTPQLQMLGIGDAAAAQTISLRTPSGASPGVQPDGSQLLQPGPNAFTDFVGHFRNASPYIEGHRGRTFVLVIPGEVVERKDVLYPLLEDISLLHVLGVRLVVVLGARPGIDRNVRAFGGQPRYVSGQRVTDAATMQAAVQAAGAARMEFEARLSKVSGNYVAAKRKGIVDGVDLGFTGMVRFIEVNSVNRQLAAGYMVLLSNLGYSAAGEVLNCDIWTVATRAAVDLGADKVISFTLPGQQVDMGLASWTPLSEAQRMLNALAAARGPEALEGGPLPGDAASASTDISRGEDLDFDRWQSLGLPMALCTACAACGAGVRRAHIVDASVDGGLLLELYSPEGAPNAAMIHSDFYQGMRGACMEDLDGIHELLAPLEAKGILKPRSRSQLAAEVRKYHVIEREAQLLGCALLDPLGGASDGADCAEIAAFCVSPEHRGMGRGDALLDYLEQESRNKGTQRILLLTTRTADWFEQRGFQPAGPAHESDLLPESRRAKVDPKRNSKLFVKDVSKPEVPPKSLQ